MVITLSISNDRIVSSDQHIIGKTNENKSTILSINVDSLLGDKDLYLEFEKSNGEKYVSKPLELKEKITESAAEYGRSINSEVVTRLEESFEKDDAAEFDKGFVLQVIESQQDQINQLQKMIQDLMNQLRGSKE